MSSKMAAEWEETNGFFLHEVNYQPQVRSLKIN